MTERDQPIERAGGSFSGHFRGGCQIKEEKPGRVLPSGNIGLGAEGTSLCSNETSVSSGTIKPWHAPQAKNGEQGTPVLQQPSSSLHGIADRSRIYKGNK